MGVGGFESSESVPPVGISPPSRKFVATPLMESTAVCGETQQNGKLTPVATESAACRTAIRHSYFFIRTRLGVAIEST